jgi:hypothetical protein
MGKSAQVPLHVWLPDSMEGPTPISALIHAATMVTAGIFMVARMSPLFELSETALVFVMTIGTITALFMGFLGIVQNDIKRVVAYSTLSQLGYMTVALGVSAYSAGIFHLMTHAFFKALLFLGAGSVIIAMLAGPDRYAVLLRFLFQGHDYRSGALFAAAGCRYCAHCRTGWCVYHGPVQFSHVFPGVPWRTAHGCTYPRTPARVTVRGVVPAGNAGDTLRGGWFSD